MKLIVFDFDGVIVDSTRECHELCILAIRSLESKGILPNGGLNTSSDEEAFRNFFQAHRRYVRKAREYFLIWKHFASHGTQLPGLTQQDFDAFLASSDKLTDEFEKEFFACRRQLQSNQTKEWLYLFDTHYDVIDQIRRLNILAPIRFLTLRDASSCLHLLQRSGISVERSQIVDASEVTNKLEGMEKIGHQSGVETQSMILLDDNVLHLKQVEPSGAKLFWALWGYVCPEHHETGATIDGLVPCLRDNWYAKLVESL